MAAAGSGIRKSGKSRAKSSTQSWFPNPSQAAEDQSGSFVDVLVSRARSAVLFERSHTTSTKSAGWHTDAVSIFTGSATEVFGSVPSLPGTTEPPTTDALGQYQPAGNNETSLAGDDLNTNVIVNAQLTHLISRDDAAQGQDAPNAPDVPMPDVPAVHDIATPRRTICGRCRKWCISAQPPADKRKCAHCVNGGLGHES